MAIYRLTLLLFKRDEQARVQVEELLTRRSMTELVAELESDGLHHEASWYRGRLKELESADSNTFWDRVFTCEPLDLDEMLFAAYRRIVSTKRRSVYACVY